MRRARGRLSRRHLQHDIADLGPDCLRRQQNLAGDGSFGRVARRSGASNTAHHCTTLGRPVMAVPGPVTSPMSAGCHDLLRRENDPALLVTCVDDVVAVVGAMGDGIAADQRPPADPIAGDVRAELDVLDPVARRVFEGLPVRRPARPDEIAQRCGVTPLEVIRSLPVLDLAGLLEASDAGYRIAARLRPRRRRV